MAELELRVGVLANGPAVQRWQRLALEQLLAVPGVRPVVWVTPPDGKEPDPPRDRWRTALYRRWRRTRFDPPAMRPERIDDLLAGVPRLRCGVQRTGHAERFDADDLEAIAAHGPDVLLRLGFGILKGGILDLPRHGVWSFHHGDEEKYRGGPPGFWEIMQGDAVTGAVLQRLTERLDGGRILRKGWFNTIDHSLAETVDTVLTHSAVWPAQVARELLMGRNEAAEGVASTTNAPVYRYPTNRVFLDFLLRQARNKARFHRRELQEHEQWNIGLLHQPISELLKEKPNLNVRWLPDPAPDAFRADPFGYRTADGQLNVLYEKYQYAQGIGDISRVRPKRDNVLKRSRVMLTTGSHLSYPYVVQHEGAVYVVPESAASGRVDLFRVNEANDALEHVRTLLEEPVYDPTVFQWQGRWWLFGTLAPLTNVALHAWHAPSLESPWEPHALNPLKLDVRSARPGGTPFVHEGRLYRPAQDSASTYGHRIAINEVLELSPDRFAEQVARVVGPLTGTAFNAGLHTVSAVGDVTLVDGKRFVNVDEQRKRVRTRKLERLKQKKRSK